MSSVSYLGHSFSGSGISPDPQKVEAITNWPQPQDVDKVRQFLGLASYYQRYIPHFADIAAPLHSLTQKGMSFHWSQECTTAFTELKKCFVQAPILAYPKLTPGANEFMVQTDASACGLGVVLQQEEHVIAYASRTLSAPERHYSVIQQELSCCGICSEAISALLPGATLHRSCSVAVALSTEDGGIAVSLGTGTAGV